MHIWSRILGALAATSVTDWEISPKRSSLFGIRKHDTQFTTNETYDNSVENLHLPVLLWHGMGDSYNSESMQWVIDSLHDTYPELEIYSIYIKQEGNKDKEASLQGDSMTQLSEVCEQIKNLGSEIDITGGFNAMGFSQGGLFVRALVETCDVKFHNIITLGSPHNGIADLPPCQPGNFLCKKKNEFIRNRIYDDYIQENSIQAQYFRDVENFDTYLQKSVFLKYVNNELIKDLDYYNNMIVLNKFVMVMFDRDETLVPKESAWFFDLEQDTGEIIPFEETESYIYDMIGLKYLHSKNKIDFLKIDDLHLKLSEKDMAYLAKNYL